MSAAVLVEKKTWSRKTSYALIKGKKNFVLIEVVASTQGLAASLWYENTDTGSLAFIFVYLNRRYFNIVICDVRQTRENIHDDANSLAFFHKKRVISLRHIASISLDSTLRFFTMQMEKKLKFYQFIELYKKSIKPYAYTVYDRLLKEYLLISMIIQKNIRLRLKFFKPYKFNGDSHELCEWPSARLKHNTNNSHI